MPDVIVQGDTGPNVTGVIHKKDEPNNVTNLTDAIVRFQMRRTRDKNLMVDELAVVDAPASGQVHYEWGENDTAYPGEYQYQWQVTFPDGTKQTTYEAKELTIRKR